MKTRRGFFVVVVDKNNNMLILHRVLNWRGWEVTKGGIDEKGRNEKREMQRELFEELGFCAGDYKIVGRSNCFLSFSYPKWYQTKWKVSGAKFRGWLVRADKGKISFSHNPEREHDGYKWLPIVSGIKKLKQANQRAAVKGVLKRFGLL